MSTEKIQELARDIAREQYTDDPDDPHWWDEGDEEEEPVIPNVDKIREFLRQCGYGHIVIDKLDDETAKQWYKDELEELAKEKQQEDDEPRNSYERYPGVVTYPNY